MPRKKQAVHASGLVEVKATVGKTIDGKRIQKSFYGHSKLDAQKKADEYKLEQEMANRTGEVFIQKEYTFGEWAAKWLEAKKGTVKNYTYETTYRSKVDKYIVPYFGKASLNSIKQNDIQAFFAKHSGLSKSMLDKFRIILFGIFDSAIDNDLCYKNPVKKINLSCSAPTEKNVYSMEQAEKLANYCIENKVIDVLIMLKTGICRSELLGLKWADVDFENCLIHIDSAVTPDTGTAVEGGTKSASGTRLIPISKELSDYLQSYCSNGTYVVTGTEKFMSPSGYANRYRKNMDSISALLDIPALTPHELRHTFGTILREKGVDIYTIQKIMGHSDIGITAKIYVHNDIEVLRKAMKL